VAPVVGRLRSAASGRGRWAIAAALGLACGAGPALAAAHGTTRAPSLEVHWTAPLECPSNTFTDALEHLLVGSAVTDPIRVEAIVEHTADGWSIHTDFDAGPGRTGQRTFQAVTCRTVTQAAALALAIAVDPSVLERLVAPVEAPPVEPLAVAQVPDAPVPAARIEPSEPPPLGPIVAAAPDPGPAEPSSRWRGLLGVAGLIDGGALPGPGGGIAATIGVLHGRFRGEVVGTRRFATRRAAAADPRVGGELSQWSLGVRGCGVPRMGAVELPLCVGVDGGQTVGQGIGLRDPLTSAQPWLAGLAEAGVAWPVRPWLALTARASLAVPVLRQDFAISGLGVVHRVGPVQGRGLVGLELRWP
jgi:hypothetical protein